eukprot:EG_transcript_5281
MIAKFICSHHFSHLFSPGCFCDCGAVCALWSFPTTLCHARAHPTELLLRLPQPACPLVYARRVFSRAHTLLRCPIPAKWQARSPNPIHLVAPRGAILAIFNIAWISPHSILKCSILKRNEMSQMGATFIAIERPKNFGFVVGKDEEKQLGFSLEVGENEAVKGNVCLQLRRL